MQSRWKIRKELHKPWLRSLQRHPVYCVPGRVAFCRRIDGHDSSNVAPTLAGRVADTDGHNRFSEKNGITFGYVAKTS